MEAAAAGEFHIAVDCANPDRMARFWAQALGYELEGPPVPHQSWKEYWVSVGVPADEVEDGYDSIVDPGGCRPRIWFQQVSEAKAVKNRLRLDLLAGGGWQVSVEERERRVGAEASRLVEAGAVQRHIMDSADANHHASAMADPEGNEFDIV
ncbi:MAG: VOC family protein [Acidimicrobiia bacterium]